MNLPDTVSTVGVFVLVFSAIQLPFQHSYSCLDLVSSLPSTFPMWGEICSSLRYGTKKSTTRTWIAPHPSGNILVAVEFFRESNYGTIERHSSSWPRMASLSSAPLASPVPAHPLGRPTPSFPDSLHDLQLAHGSIGRQISAAPCLS